MTRRARREAMNSAVQDQSGLQHLPSDQSPRPAAPIVLTARTLLRARSDITAGLRQENFGLRYVTAWNRLPEAIDRIQADVVLVDMDAADQMSDGIKHLSGHRLVTRLARQLHKRPIGLVVMTRLDFAEIEDLARAGIHAVVSPRADAPALIEQLRFALHCAQRRSDFLAAQAPKVRVLDRINSARAERKRPRCEGEGPPG
jgi:CheY-like chemotaxis protein